MFARTDNTGVAVDRWREAQQYEQAFLAASRRRHRGRARANTSTGTVARGPASNERLADAVVGPRSQRGSARDRQRPDRHREFPDGGVDRCAIDPLEHFYRCIRRSWRSAINWRDLSRRHRRALAVRRRDVRAGDHRQRHRSHVVAGRRAPADQPRAAPRDGYLSVGQRPHAVGRPAARMSGRAASTRVIRTRSPATRCGGLLKARLHPARSSRSRTTTKTRTCRSHVAAPDRSDQGLYAACRRFSHGVVCRK